MLVCNVSQSRRRVSIAASVSEAAAALDAPGTGNIVFATLVDDPASVDEHVDAFFGQIMFEAANAGSTVTAGIVYAVAVIEGAAAADSCSLHLPAGLSASVAETASAADTPDSSVTASVRFEGVLALDGPIMPMTVQPTVIFIQS